VGRVEDDSGRGSFSRSRNEEGAKRGEKGGGIPRKEKNKIQTISRK